MPLKLVDYSLVSIPVPFRLSWGKLGFSRHMFITLEDENGKRGYGEGVLYKTTHLELLPFLEKKTKKLDEPALDFALDTARRDLRGQILTPDWKTMTVTEEFFLGQEIVKKNVDFLKVKMGRNLEGDKETINKINKVYHGKVKIKLDANRGYTYQQAVDMATWGRENNVILFEEPFRGRFSDLGRFRKETKMPVMLDESILSLTDLDNAILSRSLDVLNVKLTRVGGITKANEYVRRCQKAGIKISVGCNEELDVGTAAIYTFAKSIKNLYGVEGFGHKRLEPYLVKQFVYHPGRTNRELFLFKEAWGIWTTRLENLLLRLNLLD